MSTSSFAGSPADTATAAKRAKLERPPTPEPEKEEGDTGRRLRKVPATKKHTPRKVTVPGTNGNVVMGVTACRRLGNGTIGTTLRLINKGCRLKEMGANPFEGPGVLKAVEMLGVSRFTKEVPVDMDVAVRWRSKSDGTIPGATEIPVGQGSVVRLVKGAVPKRSDDGKVVDRGMNVVEFVSNWTIPSKNIAMLVINYGKGFASMVCAVANFVDETRIVSGPLVLTKKEGTTATYYLNNGVSDMCVTAKVTKDPVVPRFGKLSDKGFLEGIQKLFDSIPEAVFHKTISLPTLEVLEASQRALGLQPETCPIAVEDGIVQITWTTKVRIPEGCLWTIHDTGVKKIKLVMPRSPGDMRTFRIAKSTTGRYTCELTRHTTPPTPDDMRMSVAKHSDVCDPTSIVGYDGTPDGPYLYVAILSVPKELGLSYAALNYWGNETTEVERAPVSGPPGNHIFVVSMLRPAPPTTEDLLRALSAVGSTSNKLMGVDTKSDIQWSVYWQMSPASSN